MKYAIAVSSKTGNTAAVAEEIRKALPEADCLYFGDIQEVGVKEAQGAEAIFAGFWTDKGTCDSGCSAFLKTLKGQAVFLFGTAGFGGSSEYYGEILQRVKAELPDGVQVADTFMCQGKMPEAVRLRYEKMRDENPEKASQFEAMIANFDKALAHPDPSDLKKAGLWAENAWKELQKK